MPPPHTDVVTNFVHQYAAVCRPWRHVHGPAGRATIGVVVARHIGQASPAAGALDLLGPGKGVVGVVFWLDALGAGKVERSPHPRVKLRVGWAGAGAACGDLDVAHNLGRCVIGQKVVGALAKHCAQVVVGSLLLLDGHATMGVGCDVAGKLGKHVQDLETAQGATQVALGSGWVGQDSNVLEGGHADACSVGVVRATECDESTYGMEERGGGVENILLCVNAAFEIPFMP